MKTFLIIALFCICSALTTSQIEAGHLLHGKLSGLRGSCGVRGILAAKFERKSERRAIRAERRSARSGVRGILGICR